MFVKHDIPLKQQEPDFNSSLGTVNTEMESGWNTKKQYHLVTKSNNYVLAECHNVLSFQIQ